jgi:hypothetical protein
VSYLPPHHRGLITFLDVITHFRANITAQEKSGMEAEINAYQSTIAELEGKLLEAKMANKSPPPAPSEPDAGIVYYWIYHIFSALIICWKWCSA